MTVVISPVNNKRKIKAFHSLPHQLYQTQAAWRPPLQMDIESIFNPKKNNYFREGECQRFLVLKDNHDVVGRFAVMTHLPSDQVFTPKMGGIGFIEMINDERVAQAMIEYSQRWLRERGYKAMRGPIHFGANFNHWGLLIDGFDQPAVYGVPYHMPYYQTLLEGTGAQKLNDHFHFTRELAQPIPARIIKIAERIKQRQNIVAQAIDLQDLPQAAHWIHQVYQQAWLAENNQQRNGVAPLSYAELFKSIQALKPVLLPELNLVALSQGEPIGFIAVLPDINEFAQQTNGKFYPWHWWKLKRLPHEVSRVRAFVIGVVPEYRHAGVSAVLGVESWLAAIEHYPNLKYYDSGWVANDNLRMLKLNKVHDMQLNRTHRTYQWHF
jgi:hypothetical protein